MYHLSTEIIGIHRLGKAIEVVYHMGSVVYRAIRSCFGSGGWVNDAPWLNDEGWNNG